MTEEIVMENPRKWWVLFGSGIMIMLINIDSTIVNLGLATIANSFKITLEQAQWVINSYLVTTAIFFVVGGKLSQLHGKRKIFLIGTALFFTGSLIAGTALNYHMLITARLLQGLGFACTLSLALVISSDAFPPSQKGLALGITVTLTGLGQALGPTLGGAILHYLNWHWIFLVNLPLCLLSYGLTIWAYPADHPTEHGHKLDKLGVVMMATVIVCILMANNNLHSWGLLSTEYLLLMGIGFVLLIIFYFFEQTRSSPLMDFRLFHNQNFSLTNIIRCIYMYSWSMLLFLVPLFLQNLLFLSPMQTGLWMLLMTLMLGIVSPITGKLTDRIGFKLPMLASMLFSVFSFGILAASDLNQLSWLIGLMLLIFGIGTGLHIPSSVNGIIMSTNQRQRGLGVGIFFTIAFIGSTMGVALSGAQINWFANKDFLSLVQHSGLQLSQQQLTALSQVVNGTHNIHIYQHLLGPELFQQLTTFSKLSFIHGFKVVLLTNALLSMVGAILCFFVQSPTQHHNN